MLKSSWQSDCSWLIQPESTRSPSSAEILDATLHLTDGSNTVTQNTSKNAPLTYTLKVWTTTSKATVRSPTQELANKRTFTAIHRKKTNRIQDNTATHLDIRDRAMGMQQAIQHQDPPNIPVKNVQNVQQCLLERLQPNPAQWLRYPVRNGSGSNQRQHIQKSQHWAK